jgi:hypothetical protein
MSRENAKLAYLSGIVLIIITYVIVALGESRRTGSNGEQVQCDTICCDSIKCDSIKCDQRVGK